MKKDKLAAMIDYMLLGVDINSDNVIKACKDAVEYGFASVCISPYYLPLVSEELEQTQVKACSVIGFPLGNTTTKVKVKESKQALNDGAEELDMVLNISALKNYKFDYVKNDIQNVVNLCKEIVVKVIIETCYLSDEEKVIACQLSEEAGADYAEVSSYFSVGGISTEDVKLMHDAVGKKMLIKASGRICTYKEALDIIGMGADRIGTNSGVEILKEIEG